MTVPDDCAGAGIEGARYRLAHAQVAIVNGKARVRRVALPDEVLEEFGGVGVGDKGLDLKDDLDNAVEDRKSEVELREPGEGDPIPLCRIIV